MRRRRTQTRGAIAAALRVPSNGGMTKLQAALFFADGRAFFAGGACMIVGVLLTMCRPVAWRSLLSRALVGLGVMLIVLSSTPLHAALYIWWGAIIVTWAVARLRSCRPELQHGLASLLVAITTSALLWELPDRRLPVVRATMPQTVYVIGDSLSAGMGLRERTWPKALHAPGQIEVIDLSRAGATVASAVQQARQVGAGPAIVFVEIGGNDLLGTTRPLEFERGLREVLGLVSRPDLHIVMFELPLPPFSNAYGRIQRRLAAELGITLLPKWVLGRVIGSDSTTLDGLHLSDAGHELMAQTIRQVLGTPLLTTRPG